MCELRTPVVTLNIARSNLAYPSQILFLGLNGIGAVFGLAYNSKTPDLYPGTIHRGISWALTGIAVSHFLARILRSCSEPKSTRAHPATAFHEEEPLVSASSSASWNGSDEHHYEDWSYRNPSDLGQAPYLSTPGMGANGRNSQHIFRILLRPLRAVLGGGNRERVSWNKSLFKFGESLRLGSIMDKTSLIFNIVMVVLIFVTICTGLVTTAGIFVSLFVLSSFPQQLTFFPARKKYLQWPSAFYQGRGLLLLWARNFLALDGKLCGPWMGLEPQIYHGDSPS